MNLKNTRPYDLNAPRKFAESEKHLFGLQYAEELINLLNQH